MHWFLNSLSSLPTIKWSTEKCPILTLTGLLGFTVSYLDKCPNTTLHVVTTTDRRGRYWGQKVGAFHGIFQNIYGQLLLCFYEKTLLPTILVTREVLRGSVALKELKRVRINHALFRLESQVQLHTFEDLKQIYFRILPSTL